MIMIGVVIVTWIALMVILPPPPCRHKFIFTEEDGKMSYWVLRCQCWKDHDHKGLCPRAATVEIANPIFSSRKIYVCKECTK